MEINSYEAKVSGIFAISDFKESLTFQKDYTLTLTVNVVKEEVHDGQDGTFKKRYILKVVNIDNIE